MSLTREFLKNCLISLPLTLAAAPSAAGEKIPDSVSLQLGEKTLRPRGHRDFCKTHEDECNVRSYDTAPLGLTQRIWNDIVVVNGFVNKAYKKVSDLKLYGLEEKWTYPVNGAGDCEDLALEKRRLLLKIGLPHSALLLTFVKAGVKEWHVVLSVRTDRGDYFLDNLVPLPYPANRSKYEILKVQNPAHSGEWLSVDEKFAAPPSSFLSVGGAAGPLIGLHEPKLPVF